METQDRYHTYIRTFKLFGFLIGFRNLQLGFGEQETIERKAVRCPAARQELGDEEIQIRSTARTKLLRPHQAEHIRTETLGHGEQQDLDQSGYVGDREEESQMRV